MKKKYLIKDNEIVYYSNSRGFVTVLKTQANYKDILDYLLDPNFKESKFLEMVDNGFDIEKESKGKIKKVKDGAVIGEINIPPAILKKIEELRSKGYEWRHYQKFWERCLKNPNPKSVELLFEFLSKYNFTITEDGCFLAYKGVRDDFKDSYSGKFDNHPGMIVEMERNKVTFNPQITCSSGLHCGALAYARNYASNVILVKVAPEDVVSVPVDHNAQKIRVCRYKVESVYREKDHHGNAIVNKKDKVLKVNNNRNSKWSQEEEALLWKMMSKMSGTVNWETVTKKLGRSKEACRKKYAQLKKNPPVVLDNVQKDKTAKKKSWAPLKSKISHSVKVPARWTDQDTKILVNMRDTGKGWKEIGKYLGKSVNSCRKRYERVNK